MRSPTERRLAYQVELARAMRLAEGYVPDADWSLRVRKRWALRLMCEMSCGPGWYDLIVAVNELIDQESPSEFRFSQIKQKFGGLRMYWHGDDPSGRIDELIGAAEEISQGMCEICGARAAMRQTRPGGYIYAACDEHARSGSDIIRVKTERISTPVGRVRSTSTEPTDE